MRKSHRQTLTLVVGLLAFTSLAMALLGSKSPAAPTAPPAKPLETPTAGTGIVSLSGHLVQDKVHLGGDGTVTLALTLGAGRVEESTVEGPKPLDMVVVLDRSGSMADAGKLDNATGAILGLLSRLSESDRFALVSYSDQVQTHCGLVPMTPSNRAMLEGVVRAIQPSGSTNLGAGLQEGLQLLTKAAPIGRVARLILISDGLANRGIIDPSVLADMASVAPHKAFAVSSIGVGLDFNEHLMTAIADKGSGSYYFMESASAFAEVFHKEFRRSRTIAAASLEIHVPLSPGVALVNASGYPIEVRDGYALFRPGDLISGESRKLFITLRIPTTGEKAWDIGPVSVHYLSNDQSHTTAMSEPLRVACVSDAGEALASIDKTEWEEKVIKEDYNLLREDVATALKEGKREEAMNRIEVYSARQQAVNAGVGSEVVSGNLEKDVGELRRTVTDSFACSPAESAVKQKANAKSLQYQGYQERRSKN